MKQITTHCTVSYSFLNYLRVVATLQNLVQSRIRNTLIDIKLTKEKLKMIIVTNDAIIIDNDTEHIISNKRWRKNINLEEKILTQKSDKGINLSYYIII